MKLCKAGASSGIPRNSCMLSSSSLLRNPFTSKSFAETDTEGVLASLVTELVTDEEDDLGATFLFLGTGLGGDSTDILPSRPIGYLITRISLRNLGILADIYLCLELLWQQLDFDKTVSFKVS